MKVKALKTFAGLRVSCTEGEEYDLDDKLAKQFIKEKLVVSVEPKKRTSKKAS